MSDEREFAGCTRDALALLLAVDADDEDRALNLMMNMQPYELATAAMMMARLVQVVVVDGVPEGVDVPGFVAFLDGCLDEYVDGSGN